MSEFTEKMVTYGADVPTALERFAGDEDLFEMCFHMLLDDVNFGFLKEQIEAKDYENAFKSAHALKGVISNLELTPLSKAVNCIVESLRSENYSNIDTEYIDVEEEYNRLKEL